MKFLNLIKISFLHVAVKSKWRELLVAFSLPRNVSKLLSENVAETDLTCLHGMRVFTVSWIIFGHSVVWVNRTEYGRNKPSQNKYKT